MIVELLEANNGSKEKVPGVFGTIASATFKIPLFVRHFSILRVLSLESLRNTFIEAHILQHLFEDPNSLDFFKGYFLWLVPIQTRRSLIH